MTTEENQLGVFWGSDGLCFVECKSGDQLSQIFHVPFSSSEIGTLEDGPLSLEGMEIVSQIQKKLRQNNIKSSTVKLSLSTKDIIFRSFIIPWMQSSEIEGVVNFEIIKYLPFALECLRYTFHPITVVEERARQLRIIFVAIKKEVLKNYIGILEQAGLKVDGVEPSTLSIIRALISKDFISNNQTLALVEKTEGGGKIVIVDKMLPYFVREFELKSGALEKSLLNDEEVLKKFVNEIRISLEYFIRQGSKLIVQEIVLLALEEEARLLKLLKEDLDIQVTSIKFSDIFGEQSPREMGFFSAYGTGVSDIVKIPIDLNFSEQKLQSKSESSLKNFSFKESVNYKLTIISGISCLTLIISLFFFSKFLLSKKYKEMTVLKQQLGIFESFTLKEIEFKKTELVNEIDDLKNIQIQSEIGFFLAAISDFFSRGAWIKSLDINYAQAAKPQDYKEKNKKKAAMKGKYTQRLEMKPRIELEGYVYLKNVQDQFRMVNKIRKDFKSDKNFLKLFDNIKLENVESLEIDGYPVTSFVIKSQ